MKPKKMRVSIGLPVVMILLFNMHIYGQTLAINEIMASNATIISDEDGDFEDWIELYNFGTEAIPLEGFGLSDNFDDPFKWVFPDVIIQPGEFLLIWASGKDKRPGQGELNTGLLREVYADIPGWTIPDLTGHPSYPDNPSSTSILNNLFEAPINTGDHYGQCIHGWIQAPVSGEYIFWISSDDYGELHLSPSDDPAQVVLIAEVPGWTNSREWDKYSQQQSATITLQEGAFYYVMALMKEHEGGDNLAVGWQLPDGALQRPIPGEYLFRDEAELHTNFKISADGEEVLLVAPSGEIIDELSAVGLIADISYGSSPDGSDNFFYFQEPTPGFGNSSQTFGDLLEPPQFSMESGFYTSGFNLSITHPDPDVEIIFTIDGSNPKYENLSGTTYQYKNSYPEQVGQPFGNFLSQNYQSLIYSSPITITDRSGEPDKLTQISSTWHYTPYYFPATPVTKGTVVRATATKDNAISSKSVSNSYFVFPEGRDKYSLPVVSIAIQEDSFFDYEYGIYVAGVVFDDWRSTNTWEDANGGTPANYWRNGLMWEYPGNIELFAENSDVAAFNQGFGCRIHGGWTRSFQNKSLRLYAKGVYGNDMFNYSFFPDNEHTAFKRLMLRNSGNDAHYTFFRDAAIQKIVSGLNFDTQDYVPSILFINGEYWGMYNIRERYDKYYLARVYDVDPENVDILEYDAVAKEGDANHYMAMVSYIENNNLSQSVHYDYIKTQMDIENFADYEIAQIFAGNTDWPGNNIDYWRLRTDEYIPGVPPGHDGRWRWLMFDTDFGFGLFGTSYNHNTLAFATDPNGPGWPNPPWSTFLLRNLLTNPEFEQYFITRFADLLNTTFIPERTIEIINNIKEKLEPEMPEHIHRWSGPSSMSNWNNDVNAMVIFANLRPFYQIQHIKEFFNIDNNVNVTLDVDEHNHGHIRINTISIVPETHGVPELPYPWTGTYFHNIPIEAEAVANPGFTFSHWEGSHTGTEPVITILPQEDITLTAHFTQVEPPEPSLLHYWHFNDLPSGNLTEVLSDYTLAGLEAGKINYPGTGEGYMDRRTHSEDDPVSNLNLLIGQQPDQGAVLRVRNPSNTRELITKASSYGFENILVVFATVRTSNGATQQEFYFSSDNGQNWNQIGNSYIINLLPQWELQLFNLAEYPQVNNNDNLQFKVLFGGENAGGTSGNNRFDNFSIHGESLQASLISIEPNEALQGEISEVVILAENTFWLTETPQVSITHSSGQPQSISATEITAENNFTLMATFTIPTDATIGLYNLEVNELLLSDAFTITNSQNALNLSSNDVKVYPNPANEKLWIEISKSATVRIFDMDGRTKLVKTISANRNSISLKTLNKGIYLLEITSQNKKLTRRLVVI
jgi:uncharacterized repeat protein (TIGR02543 family)